MSILSTQEQALRYLTNGGSFRYSMISGCVIAQKKSGEPDSQVDCDFGLFLELLKKELVKVTQKDVMGYPYFADSFKSSIFGISETGKKALEK